MFIGLMGLGNDGMLYLPNGRKLIKLSLRIGMVVQRVQQCFARTINRYTN